VAELVKKYQEYLPAEGVQDLTRTALAPRLVMSESEQEYPHQLTRRSGIHNKSRHRAPVKKVSTSDFEQGYVANAAPRYLKKTGTEKNKTRIPALIGSHEFHESPRKPSRGASRSSKDKPTMRLPLTTGSKSAFRKPTIGTGIKVPNIAKHFERLSRDAERSKSGYTVIRGKRARPVVSARAKVRVLNSLKDAIGDDSESSDSSSEADDEDEGNEGNEEERRLDLAAEKSPEQEHISSESTSKMVPLVDPFPTISLNPPDNHDSGDISHVSPPERIHSPPSPFLSAAKTKNEVNLTPPTSDHEQGANGAEMNSILRALSGFWPQPFRHSMEGDDSMGDPEHIFRDSSMVVRIDEPTSIIALALECVFYISKMIVSHLRFIPALHNTAICLLSLMRTKEQQEKQNSQRVVRLSCQMIDQSQIQHLLGGWSM
jgi:1-phosphatidylinositol-3-phosphate 5-kinase